MKKILVCLIWLCTVTACDKVTDLQPQTALPKQDVPEAVVNAVRQTFPQVKTAHFEAVGTDQTWRVDFEANGAYIAFFDTQGKFYNAYHQIDQTALSPAVRQTLSSQGATVQAAFEDLSAQQVVEGYVTQLKSKQNVLSTAYFDYLGAAVFSNSGITPLLTMSATAKADYNLYFILPNDLPAAIKTYVSQTYNGSVITKSAVAVTGGVKQYLVYGTVNGVAFELYFNEAGGVTKTFIYLPPASGQDGTITQASLPAAVTDWLNQNYPGWKLEKGAKSTTAINLIILVNNASYSLLFDLNWNFTSARAISTTTPRTPVTPAPATVLTEADLPDAVKQLFTRSYPGWTFVKGSKSATAITVVIEANGRYLFTFDATWKLERTEKIG